MHLGNQNVSKHRVHERRVKISLAKCEKCCYWIIEVGF